jgi:bifunctional DNA-binding transcriptional regulator/antitoxin component of YhaV-PrlF toxin-antitoxin module
MSKQTLGTNKTSSKFQVTIPKEVRGSFKLSGGALTTER